MKKRKKYLKFFCLFIILFFYSYSINASCSIGATPLGMGAKAKPGEEVLVTWNLYNLYGDRTTHITLNKISGPDWEIIYNPALHEEKYDISGIIVSKTENLAIEKSSVILKIPENPPEGISYVKHPNKEGYIPVKQINIYVKIPKDAELWKDYKFVFEARGDCFTEPGTVIPALATQLKVDITPQGDFYEKPINTENKNFLSKITGAVIGSNTTTKIFAITTFILILIISLLLIKMKKKTFKKNQNKEINF